MNSKMEQNRDIVVIGAGLTGLATAFNLKRKGRDVLMLNKLLCFFAIIGMIYHRAHTRDIRQLNGLMRIVPFLSVAFAIAGLANLGLPGLSGFVAEMTIFVGSFENADTFHRVLTIMATTSIVVAAVYILRMIGKILYGVNLNPEHAKLHDAHWEERFAVICLIVCIAGIGLAPGWLSDVISDSVAPVIDNVKSVGHLLSQSNPFK